MIQYIRTKQGDTDAMTHTIEQSIQTAEASLRMEGLSVSETCKELCRQLLAGEISLEQYMACVTAGTV